MVVLRCTDQDQQTVGEHSLFDISLSEANMIEDKLDNTSFLHDCAYKDLVS